MQENVIMRSIECTNQLRRKPVYLGVTEPQSLQCPTDEDIRNNAELLDSLRDIDSFRPHAKLSHRMLAVLQLKSLVNFWVQAIARVHGVPPLVCGCLAGRLMPHGGYRLGAYDEFETLKAVCLVPNFIRPESFFDYFYELLHLEFGIEDSSTYVQNFVPTIRMVIHEVEITLKFVQLPIDVIPPQLDICDNRWLRRLSAPDIDALNQCRNTREILRQVPCTQRYMIFLNVAKFWCQCNGVFSSQHGYLGKTALAIMTARIYQLYPNADTCTLLQKFFAVYSRWQWPTPIMLKMPDKVDDLGLYVWDPYVNRSDARHVMPVICPAYPHHNTAHTVNKSTKKTILDELRRAVQLTKKVLNGDASWDQLFLQPSFMHKYEQYVAIIAGSHGPNHFDDWCAFVQSQLHFLVKTMERSGNFASIQLHPKKHVYTNGQPNAPKRLFDNVAAHSCLWFVGVAVAVEGTGDSRFVDLNDGMEPFANYVTSLAKQRGLLADGGNHLECRQLQPSQLQTFFEAA